MINITGGYRWYVEVIEFIYNYLHVVISGISFCDRLDDIMKYTDNTTLQGNYIVQKYIGE